MHTPIPTSGSAIEPPFEALRESPESTEPSRACLFCDVPSKHFALPSGLCSRCKEDVTTIYQLLPPSPGSSLLESRAGESFAAFESVTQTGNCLHHHHDASGNASHSTTSSAICPDARLYTTRCTWELLQEALQNRNLVGNAVAYPPPELGHWLGLIRRVKFLAAQNPRQHLGSERLGADPLLPLREFLLFWVGGRKFSWETAVIMEAYLSALLLGPELPDTNPSRHYKAIWKMFAGGWSFADINDAMIVAINPRQGTVVLMADSKSHDQSSIAEIDLPLRFDFDSLLAERKIKFRRADVL